MKGDDVDEMYTQKLTLAIVKPNKSGVAKRNTRKNRSDPTVMEAIRIVDFRGKRGYNR